MKPEIARRTSHWALREAPSSSSAVVPRSSVINHLRRWLPMGARGRSSPGVCRSCLVSLHMPGYGHVQVRLQPVGAAQRRAEAHGAAVLRQRCGTRRSLDERNHSTAPLPARPPARPPARTECHRAVHRLATGCWHLHRPLPSLRNISLDGILPRIGRVRPKLFV